MHGSATLKDVYTVVVTDGPDGGRVLQGIFLLIATGSSPVRSLDIPFDDERICDSNQSGAKKTAQTVSRDRRRSHRAEYASTFAALDAEVFLIDGRPELLPFLDREIAQSSRMAMEDAGVQVLLQERSENRCIQT